MLGLKTQSKLELKALFLLKRIAILLKTKTLPVLVIKFPSHASHQPIESKNVVTRRHPDEMKSACEDEVKMRGAPSNTSITAYNAERRAPQWLVTIHTPCTELRK